MPQSNPPSFASSSSSPDQRVNTLRSDALRTDIVPALDYVKAVAILLIMAFHFFGTLSSWQLNYVDAQWFFAYWKNFNVLALLKFIEAYGYLGVNVFVIASGFGLYFSRLKERAKTSPTSSQPPFNFKDFFRKRIVRLLPGAIVGTLIVLLIKGLILGFWPLDNWWENFYPYLAGSNLFLGWKIFPPISGETWFLGLILQLYLLYPWLVKGLERLGRTRFLLVLFAISVGFRIVYFIFFKDTNPPLSYGLSLGRLFEFGFGMVLAEHYFNRTTSQRRPLAPHPVWLAGLLCFLGYFFPALFPFADLLTGIGLFTLLWLLAPRTKLPSFWKKLSEQSYLIFLTHHALLAVFQKYLSFEPWSWQGIIIFVIFAAASYFLALGCDQLLKAFSAIFKKNSFKPKAIS